MIEIDGSYGEGGGQILRLSVALSAITGKPVRIYNIRAKRRNPGLSYQHLTAIKALAEVCKAKTVGVELRSKELEFYPGKLRGGKYFFDVGTAGSVFLVMQSLLPALIFAERESVIKLRGGTDVPKAPPADYFVNVFSRLLEKMGIKMEVKVLRRGFYPKGGGEVLVKVFPVHEISGLKLEERGELRKVEGRIWLYSLPDHIGERMKREAMILTYNLMKVTPKLLIEKGSSISPGTGIVMWGEYESTIIGADSLGKKGKRAEEVARECVSMLNEHHRSKATLDINAADQLLIFMALAKSPSSFVTLRLTSHTSTCMWLIRKFVEVEFEREEEPGGVRIKIFPRGFS